MKSIEVKVFPLAALILAWMIPVQARSSDDTGKLKIHVEPKQAYVFVDGKAIREGSQTLRLAQGTHTVEVHNYGYTTNEQKVQVNPSEKTRLNVDLQRSGDNVSGPFADLEFKGIPVQQSSSME
jgi:hypothetical protein